MHLTWTSRDTQKVELDFILFPGDAVFQKIETVKDGRVYLLKFLFTKQRQFFWMQEPNADKDKEIVTKINTYLEAEGN